MPQTVVPNCPKQLQPKTLKLLEARGPYKDPYQRPDQEPMGVALEIAPRALSPEPTAELSALSCLSKQRRSIFGGCMARSSTTNLLGSCNSLCQPTSQSTAQSRILPSFQIQQPDSWEHDPSLNPKTNKAKKQGKQA